MTFLRQDYGGQVIVRDKRKRKCFFKGDRVKYIDKEVDISKLDNHTVVVTDFGQGVFLIQIAMGQLLSSELDDLGMALSEFKKRHEQLEVIHVEVQNMNMLVITKQK
jgi:hypothetical protein